MKYLKAFILATALSFSTFTNAQSNTTIFFDAEVMAWLKDLAKPLLNQANIDPKDVNIYVINSNEVNAFVTPSKDIFFYTGLILKADHAEEVQGVLAHEIGHIKANHYLKTLAHSKEKTVPIILGAILGVGAAALGSGEAATALLSGGIAGAQDQILRHSRTHERQADKIAADLLNSEGFSANGLTSFFSKLQTSNLLYSKTPPEWLVTHPLPKQRISAMLSHIESENIQEPKHLNPHVFKRIQAKLETFTQSGGFILRKYGYENTPEAKYALALLKALEGKTQESIDSLKNANVNSYSKPFQEQLIAMLYQDLGEYQKANSYFSSAIKQRPDLPLLRMAKARNDIILEDYQSAIEQLTIVSHAQPNWSSVFKQLGIASGKQGNLFDSHIYLAREALLRKSIEDVKTHLQLAENNINEDNPKQKQMLNEIKDILKIEKD